MLTRNLLTHARISQLLLKKKLLDPCRVELLLDIQPANNAFKPFELKFWPKLLFMGTLWKFVVFQR